MENVDYSFMTTGFNNIKGVDQLDASEKATLLSTIVVYFEEAIKIAEGYVLYEGRKVITGEDIVLALKVQALDHNDVWDKEETKTRVREGYNEIYTDLLRPDTLQEGSDDELKDEYDEGDESNDENNEDKQGDRAEKYCDNNNDCKDNDELESHNDDNKVTLEKETYLLIKLANDRWLEWEPDDEINIILKSAIDKTEDKIKNKDMD